MYRSGFAPLLWRGIKGEVFLFLLFIASSSFSQEITKGEVYTYARKVVDTMTSQSMHGRGYINYGTKIAANYIKSEYTKAGLKTFGKEYYQSFSFPINTFPSEMTVSIGSPLTCGKDYIVRGDCGSLKGEFTLERIVVAELTGNKKELKKFTKRDLSNTFIIIDKQGTDPKDAKTQQFLEGLQNNSCNAKGIIELEETKLTGDFSMEAKSYPALIVLRNSIPADAKTISLDIVNERISSYPSQNVIGYVQGSQYPDSFVVFSAHYDHLGQMGKSVYFPGANDNASGCAMLLNLVKYYSMPEHRPKYSIAFMAFGGEEVGLLGSRYYTENPLFPLKNIKFLLNMDIMGTGEDGITVVNGTLFKNEFDKMKQINTENDYIKDVKIRGKAANSDHYFFSENGVKAFFIYTMGGIKAYHDIYDRPETLPLNEFEDLFKLITKFGDYLQN
ncbi:MAG: peptidase [Bacteroidetes bacterium]|nr:peptidase [Bacteroidota bacterium]